MEKLVDIDQLFDEAQDVFRLELLSNYSVEEEKENFDKFLKGEPREKSEGVIEWCELLEDATKSGRTFRRVHVIPASLSDYLRYEIEWGYYYTSKAGEQINLTSEHDYLKILPSDFEPRDAFVFDDKYVFEMLYDEQGQYKGSRLVNEESKRQKYISLKDKLLEHSLPLNKYLEKKGYVSG